MSIKVLLGLFFTLLLTACSANHNTAYRSFSVTDGSGAMVDIKQRAVIVSQETYSDSNGDPYTQTIVCAEPSPDALSAFAAELAAEGGNGEVGVSLAAATQETASFVGLRTQSIQLLRDAFYRACEGYMSGALTSVQFDILSRRYQRYMVALLGIEQLTGAVRTPSVTLATEGTAEAARSLSQLQNEIQSTNQRISELEQDRANLQTVIDNGSDDEKAQAQAKFGEKGRELESLRQNLSALQEALSNNRGLVAGGSTSAAVSELGLPSGRSDQTIQAVAEEVASIVNTVLRSDDLAAYCIALLGSRVDQVSNEVAFSATSPCPNVIASLTARREAALVQQSEMIASLQNQLTRRDITVEEATKLIAAYTKLISTIDEASAPVAR